MAVMVGLWKKILITTVQVNSMLIPSEAGMRIQIDLNCCYQKFCHKPTIIAISWLPSGFHNFFTLCRAARLGHILFNGLNGCF